MGLQRRGGVYRKPGGKIFKRKTEGTCEGKRNPVLGKKNRKKKTTNHKHYPQPSKEKTANGLSLSGGAEENLVCKKKKGGACEKGTVGRGAWEHLKGHGDREGGGERKKKNKKESEEV